MSGPYFVAYVWAGHDESWNCDTLDAALLAFWQDGHLSQPAERFIADVTGRRILYEDNRLHTVYAFDSTRQVRKRMQTAAPSTFERLWAHLKEHAHAPR